MTDVTRQDGLSGNTAEPELRCGTILFEQFEVERCIGAGVTGVVYKCKHYGLGGQSVALKLLPAEIANDETMAARINREIRASYNISNPHVARFYECVRDERFVALAMEYIDGGTLQDLIDERRLADIDQVLFLLTQMATGLAAIHHAGVVHRDLKPDNILITSDGIIKITDFGLAIAARSADARVSDSGIVWRPGYYNQDVKRVTQISQVVGTPYYISPEYLRDGTLDSRSDIYSLGVIAYEMLTYQQPHDAADVTELFRLKLERDPCPVRMLNPRCPSYLDELVMRCLTREPGDRIQRADDVLRELRLVTYSEVSSNRRPVYDDDDDDEIAIRTSGRQRMRERWERRQSQCQRTPRATTRFFGFLDNIFSGGRVTWLIYSLAGLVVMFSTFQIIKPHLPERGTFSIRNLGENSDGVGVSIRESSPLAAIAQHVRNGLQRVRQVQQGAQPHAGGIMDAGTSAPSGESGEAGTDHTLPVE